MEAASEPSVGSGTALGCVEPRSDAPGERADASPELREPPAAGLGRHRTVEATEAGEARR